jgi:hypothetical protein
VTIRQHLARILRDPSLVAVELAWRWAFGTSAIALVTVAVIRLQHAVVILSEEQKMLTSRAPLQVAEAIVEVWQRAHPLAVRLGLVVVPAMVVLWVIAVTVGRGFVLNRILELKSGGPRWSSLLTLHLLRAVSVFALIGAYIECSRATVRLSNPESPNYFAALLVFLVLFSIVVIVWSVVHWMLSLACIFAAREQMSAIASLRRTTRWLRTEGRRLASIATLNGTARTFVAIVFTFLGLFPLVFYRVPILFWTLEVAIFVLYCAVSDILLLARLSAYIEAAQPTMAPAITAEN